MHVPCNTVFSLKDIYYGIQQFVKAYASLCHSRHHWRTHHSPKRLIIYMCAAGLQLIVHIKRNNHLLAQINKFCGKKEITLQI